MTGTSTARTIPLIGELHQVAGPELTHPWDANGFLLMGNEPVLIDCGGALGAPALVENLASVGVAPADVRHVLATHSHWDHLSAAPVLLGSGARLAVHAAEVEQVEAGDAERTASFLYDEPYPAMRVDLPLQGGEVLELGAHRIEVHHTPGHSPGGTSYLVELDGLRVLFAGDTLWGGFSERVRSDLDDWHRSLALLASLEPDLMTVGHAAPGIIHDAAAKLREAQQQLGVYMNPWFKPFHVDFRY